MASLFSPAPLLLLVALLAPLAAFAGGRIRPGLAAPVGGGMALVAFAITIWGAALSDPDRVSVTWAGSWDLRFTFVLDGLAVVFALLATGIGALVTAYSARYIPLHLHHEHRDERDVVPFLFYLLLFMAAMVGLVMAQDTIALFLFWDLTAVASFFLIGYDRNARSVQAALTAIVITGVTAILILIGVIMLHDRYGSWDLPTIIAAVGEDGLPGGTITLAVALILAGGLAKSAQVPFHFWLPQAMAAPTPVSSYLHSAAMVAAGVFLVGRFYPLAEQSDLLLWALRVVGLASMVVGGLVALTRRHLKQILAWSTISQYGYVVLLFGLGGDYGVAGACFYVMAHGLAKCALFLTAGSVIEAAGTSYLDEVGGLARRLPLLAVASLAAAATIVALPLTLGFFKDELFFAAAVETGPFWVAASVGGAALTFAYIGRFWLGIFIRHPERGRTAQLHPLSGLLVWPIVVLGALGVAGGLFPGPITGLANEAATVARNATAAIDVETAYHLDTRPENLMALAAWAIGIVLIVSERLWQPAVRAFSRLGDIAGPERIYDGTLDRLNHWSDFVRQFEVRDLRSRVASILAPAGVLVAIGLIASDPTNNAFRVGSVSGGDLLPLLMMIATVIAALTSTLARDHFALALVLSGVGFSLACVYAFSDAPNVALVAVLIETVFTVLFIATLVLLPRWVLRDVNQEPDDHDHNGRDAFIGVIAGLLALLVVWSTLSQSSVFTSVGDEFVAQTPDAHGGNVVSVILADFRGLDTLGEITVIGIALLGIAGLLYRGRLR
ncbi:MAG: Na(+) H(+) antiporter subunit A / Na(+) H(+) antiporter subunit B [uncultured Thermomicrobiales bacterium]|uniref:Na(+) H(+) antiporter subunit A / Na(+) H(+) antiporter subunit B n=1 Tax=uncultured Thermomicrobiales bacterium TaxID=1645740 RepID=A0A6J4V408_9BACT|nr:MAG: Na(+) H(+) antiporter subunit A / Na(+) H(+) antiporter subunit B [uncultured Thermomicrobiales bacterium]